MSLKTACIVILALALGAGGGLYVGHRWGGIKGWEQGRAEGYAKGRVDSNMADCVYLTQSFRKESLGETVAARDLRYRLLYGAAIELSRAIDNDLLEKEERQSAYDVLAGVGGYYWANPSSTSFFNRKDWTDGPTKNDLDVLFKEHASTAQDAAKDSENR